MAYLKAKVGVFAKESKSDELILWTYYRAACPRAIPSSRRP